MSTLLADPGASTVPPPSTEDEAFFEIIDGQEVELPPMSAYASVIAAILTGELYIFASTHPLGRSYPEMLFRLPLNGSRNRRPDVAFVTFERWPQDRAIPLRDNAWDVVPDLAVEVISPTDLVDELMQKLVEYFQAEVRLVWVVHPLQRLVYVYETLTQVRILTLADELDGGAVLPGFRLPVAKLFPEAVPAS